MKICVTTDSWKPVWGGGQEHIWQTSKILVEKYGCRIDILAPNLGPASEEYYEGNLRVLRLGPKFKFPNFFARLVYLASIIYFQLSNNYSIIHSQSHDTLFLLPILKILRPKSKFLFTAHGKPIGLYEIPWTFVVNNFHFDELLTAAKRTIAKNATVVGNGVDVAKFDTLSGKKDRNKFGIIWIGRKEDPVKGVEYLETAFEHLKKKYPKMELKIISGRYTDQNIVDLKSSDLFVLPSLSEGLPLVLLEAMAAKLPIVTTDVGDCRDLVEKSNSGEVVPKGNSNSLAEGIERMFQSKDRHRLGENGYHYVRNHYTWDKIAEKIFKLYEKTTAKT